MTTARGGTVLAAVESRDGVTWVPHEPPGSFSCGLVSLEYCALPCTKTLLELTLGSTATVTLYEDDPAAHSYSVTMGSVVKGPANVSDVTPLFLAGDLGKAVSLGGDEWQLGAGWSGAAPISVWGDHWAVTFEGVTFGEWVYDAGTGDRLTLHVMPEPRSAVWLGMLALVARMTRRPGRA